MKRNIPSTAFFAFRSTQTLVKAVSKLFLLLVGSLFITSTVWSQTNSNVTINTTAVAGLANGAWTASGSGATKLYTFAPNADNAQLNVAEIVDCLTGATATVSGLVTTTGAPGSVTILTGNSLGIGTQAGTITFSAALTAANTSTVTAYTLSLTANGSISIGAAINLTGAAGANGNPGGTSGLGDNIALTAGSGGTVSITGALTTTGGKGGNGAANGNGGGVGSAAGNISIIAPGGVPALSAALTAIGGAGGTPNGQANG